MKIKGVVTDRDGSSDYELYVSILIHLGLIHDIMYCTVSNRLVILYTELYFMDFPISTYYFHSYQVLV